MLAEASELSNGIVAVNSCMFSVLRYSNLQLKASLFRAGIVERFINVCPVMFLVMMSMFVSLGSHSLAILNTHVKHAGF